MATRMVPLSVRISEDDAEFLATRQIAGANTPSEKLRAILASERRRQEGDQDFAAAARVVEDMLLAPKERVRAGTEARSDFVATLYDRLPEITATLIAEAPQKEAEDQEFMAFERRLADLTVALAEEVVREALTKKSRTFDPDLFETRLEGLIELVELIALRKERGTG